MTAINIKNIEWKIVKPIGDYFILEQLDVDRFPIGVYAYVKQSECL